MWRGGCGIGDVVYLSLAADRNAFSVFGFTANRFFWAQETPKGGLVSPPAACFFFFHGLPPPWGTPWPICLSLSLSLSCCRRRPPACLCLPPACRRLPPPPPLLSQKGVGPSLISGKLALTYPALGWVRERGRCLQGSVAHCMGCSRARGLMQCCNRVNLQLEV